MEARQMSLDLQEKCSIVCFKLKIFFEEKSWETQGGGKGYEHSLQMKWEESGLMLTQRGRSTYLQKISKKELIKLNH